MRTSVIIPVWNGESVITQCLAALFSSSAHDLLEVICVENASADGSLAALRASPSVRVLPQPVNLGFAGGIAAGVATASGDLLFLLNQDALVRPGWLGAISEALKDNPHAGIAGCTIYHADGSLDHAGAQIARPQAEGVHLTDRGNNAPRSVEYVTGAAMAVRRSCWDALGGFDQGFYPAYFEESDFCLRAAEKGMSTIYVPKAEVDHLRSSRESQADPIRHWANQQRSRYRFVSKHFRGAALEKFFACECEALARETGYATALGRFLGARDTLRALPDILTRRGAELGVTLPTELHIQLAAGFTGVLQLAFAATQHLQPLTPPYAAERGLAARGREAARRWLGKFAVHRNGSAANLSEQYQALDRRLRILEALVKYDYR